MKKLLFLFYIIFAIPLFSYEYDFAVSSLFRNEARFLKEWIEYHRLVGVQHFYLYNNLSTDNYLEVLTPYIENGLVELIEFPKESRNSKEWHLIQLEMDNDVLSRTRGKVKWLALLDSDEFLLPIKEDSLIDLFKSYEDDIIGGVCVNWFMFGTSNVNRIPDDKLMIETLIYCDKAGDTDYKSVVRPERVQYCGDAHYCRYLPGYMHCTPQRGNPFASKFVQIDEIRINHYWTRDMEFYKNEKIPRQLKIGKQRYNCSQKLAKYNVDTDDIIFRFVEDLRKIVFSLNP